MESVKSLLESELLRVELIAVGFLLLLLLIKSLGVNIGNFGYVSLLVLLVFPILWFMGRWLVSSIKRINFPETEPWMWITALVTLLLIIFWNKIPSIKKPGKFSWNWLWGILIIILTAWGGWLVWSTIIVPWQTEKYAKEYQQPIIQFESSQNVARPSEKYFDLQNGSMVRSDDKLLFDQGPGKLLKFAPKEVGTVVYTITKAENETRTWRVEVTRCSNGKTIFNHLDLEPYDAAKRGVSYLSVEPKAFMVVE